MPATYRVATNKLSLTIHARRSSDDIEVFDIHTHHCLPRDLLELVRGGDDVAEITLTWTLDISRRSGRWVLAIKNPSAVLYICRREKQVDRVAVVGHETHELPVEMVSGLMENYKAEIEQINQDKKREM